MTVLVRFGCDSIPIFVVKRQDSESVRNRLNDARELVRSTTLDRRRAMNDSRLRRVRMDSGTDRMKVAR